MSTKLNTALQTSRSIYEAEKEKFLDALADFIDANRAAITFSDHLMFVMKVDYVGNGEKGRAYCTYSFSTNLTEWQKPFTLAISEDSVIKILENEYNASITQPLLDKKSGKTYDDITLPFV